MKPKTYLDIYPPAANLRRTKVILEATVKHFEDINMCGSYMDVIDELRDEVDSLKLQLRERAFYTYTVGR